jgi:hypothetical protein
MNNVDYAINPLLHKHIPVQRIRNSEEQSEQSHTAPAALFVQFIIVLTAVNK